MSGVKLCQSLKGFSAICYSAVEVLGAGPFDGPCQAQTVSEAQQRPLGSLLRGNSTLLAANRRLEGEGVGVGGVMGVE